MKRPTYNESTKKVESKFRRNYGGYQQVVTDWVDSKPQVLTVVNRYMRNQTNGCLIADVIFKTGLRKVCPQITEDQITTLLGVYKFTL
jgi:hypothetical protein